MFKAKLKIILSCLYCLRAVNYLAMVVRLPG